MSVSHLQKPVHISVNHSAILDNCSVGRTMDGQDIQNLNNTQCKKKRTVFNIVLFIVRYNIFNSKLLHFSP